MRTFILYFLFFFFFNDPATTEIYTLSLHDALPILSAMVAAVDAEMVAGFPSGRLFLDSVEQAMAVALVNGYAVRHRRSEEHTSELQSRGHLVCRLLLEKKKKNNIKDHK